LMCLTALPAMPTEVSAPIQPVSLCAIEPSHAIVGSAPPRLYRPPIAFS
jgi:hypothetical protein